jgi:pyruvate formate lyase activating enzyme
MTGDGRMRRNAEQASTWLSRRDLLACFLRASAGLCAAGPLLRMAHAAERTNLKEALYWQPLSGGRTQCLLCPNKCIRGDGAAGMCRARGNRGGKYYSLAYGRPCVIALDEVEKCPLNHFQIQGKAFSIATAGCNLACKYCQNWTFSQAGPDEVPKSYEMTPQEVVAKAVENKAGAVAYFYTEPTVYYEYMFDIARLAHARNLKNVMVTAGYINPEPLKAVLPYIDAVVMGLKGWDEKYYRDYIGGELAPVKETIKILAAAKNVWWEVVTLIIPTLNDDMDRVAGMAAWLQETAGPERPLHFTRFRPEYKLKQLPMTPAATLTRARETAMKAGLKYVYVGNMPGHEGGNTYCPRCGKLLVERLGFTVLKKEIRGGKCAFCGYQIGGIWL